MPIDAQSIASIGQNTADIAGSTMKAYTLADAVNRQQLGQMQLASEKEEQADLAKLKTLSQDPKYSLSTPEGQNAYVAEALKINPRLGMQLQKQMNEAQRGAIELGDAKIKQYQERLGVYDNILAPGGGLLEQNEKLPVGDPKKLSPTDLKMQILNLVTPALNAAKSQKLSYGESVIRPEDAQQIAQILSIQDPAQFLSAYKKVYDGHQGAKDKIMAYQQKKTGLENVESEIAARGETARYHREEIDVRKRELSLKERKDAEMRSGGLSDEAVDSLSNQILAGAKPQEALANLGRGAQGATDIRKVQNEVARKMKEAGMSANDILAKRQEVAGALKEVQQAANIAAKVNYAENEIMRLAPKLSELSDKVPRGSFVPLNKLLQMKDTAISDPDLKRFRSFNQTMLNAYDLLGARGGSDVGKRQANHQALITADSPEAYAAALDAIVQEGTISSEAGAASMKSPLRKSPTPGPASPTAVPSPAATGGAGGGNLPEITASGPKGQKLVLRNGQWVPK